MRLQDFYPIIVTEHPASCRDFYRRWFGLEVVFEATWFILLSDGAGGRVSRFGLFDPGGVWIDVVEQIEPEEGWWDAYRVETRGSDSAPAEGP